MIDKFKKEVGFIKNSSSKKNIRKQERSISESSDSFSSFDYEPIGDRQEEFSPYRHPITSQEQRFNSNSHQYVKEDKNRIMNNKSKGSLPNFSNQILRNNFIRQVNSKSNQENQSKEQRKKEIVVNHQDHYQGKITSKKVDQKGQVHINDEFEQELSLSNIHKFQKSKASQKDQLNEQSANKKTIQLPKYKNYIQPKPSSSSESSEVQNLQKRQTLKQPKIKQDHKFPNKEDEEELITQYDKREFKDKSIKRAILEQHNPKVTKGKGTYQTKGGICFELDTRQFKGNPSSVNAPKKKKKKVEVDQRLLLIQRREMAKLYDRKARGRVFGYY